MDFPSSDVEVPMRGVGVLSLLLVSSTAFADYKLALSNGPMALSTSGDTIHLTGGGTFDPDTQIVKMSGAYVVMSRDQVVLRRGTWRVHQFTRFIAWPSNVEMGGILEVMATLTSDGGAIDQQKMRFTCLVNKPATFGADEGVTVGNFMEEAGGMVRFVRR
jgi:hypothetical protein